MVKEENIKLGVAIIGAGIIGGLCWKFRKKIVKSLLTSSYTTYQTYDLPSYTLVKGHWRFDRSGKVSYVKPHYRAIKKNRY